MSNRKADVPAGQLPSALDFWLEQRLKDVWTAMPGIVLSYDPEAKRARVQPALRLVTTDGTEMSRAPIPDVPVMHPGGGGMVAVFPMAPGDKVLLVFSARGVAEFKRIWAQASPCPDSLFSERDAFALPMGRARNITPADSTAACLQTEDGETAITLKPGVIRLRAREIYHNADRIEDLAY